MAGRYDHHSREELIRILEKRDRERKLGLVWERDEIERDRAVDEDFIAASLEPGLCERPAPWENLVIEGDNYDALRWLRLAYAGRVKCIYIDPPYNTGNRDWVYNDHYMDPNDRYRHSTWLEFLFRRLTLARDLLAGDGVLLCSINDDNRAKLELLMDQALPGMRVGSLVWRTRTGSNADQLAFMSPDHEHVLVYAQPDFQFGGNAKTFDMYSNPDNDPRGDWRKDNLTLGFSFQERPNLFYPLIDPCSGVAYPCNPNAVWRYATASRLRSGQRLQSKPIEEWIELGQIIFPQDQRVQVWKTKKELIASIRAGDVPKSGRSPLLREDLPDLDFWIGRKVGFGTPAFKRYKQDLRNATQPLSSWVTPRAEAGTVDDGANTIVSGTNDEGAKVIKEVFGQKAFNYAKPVSLIRELIRQSTGQGDLVLDFFAGSSTTAQAVMELNAEDGGSRRFIMVSSTEATEAEPDKNLCHDITAERIRRLNRLADGKYAELSAGFAYLKTRSIGFADLDYDLAPQEIWTALEAIHHLPLTVFEPDLSFNEHEGEKVTLILVDRPGDALRQRLAAWHRRHPLFLYVWAKGALRDWTLPPEAEVHGVRETLARRFQQ